MGFIDRRWMGPWFDRGSVLYIALYRKGQSCTSNLHGIWPVAIAQWAAPGGSECPEWILP